MADIRTVRLRTGLVMTPKGGAFGRLLPLFKLGVGGPIGNGRQWWPWITLEDEIRAISFCLSTESIRGAVNLGSPTPVRNAEVAKALGAALHRPSLLAVPTVALRIALGEFSADITSSQRMLPHALTASGFTFTHADIPAACTWLIDQPTGS